VPDREDYDLFRVSPADPSTLRCEDVERMLTRLAGSSAGALKVERFAESYQGRPIYLATIGSGPRRVLLWSQMHGDEPTHTAVLLDLLSYLTKHADDKAAAEILAGTTLCALPMLCPDGAAAGTRYNAQHIDVNRDSARLETPEGRALLRAVETLRPEFGFNLHNQNARTAIGIPPKPAAVAVAAPPLDAALTEIPQIRAAMQVAVCFAQAVRSRAAGMIARYDADYMPWSFGERIQAMGVVTVLVEAGGWPGPDPAPIVEVHFDGLVATLRAIADGSYRDADPGVYERLPRANELKLFDAVVVGAHVLDADCSGPVWADLGINHSHGQRLSVSLRPDGKIVDLGDLGTSTGKEVIDAGGCLVLPGRIAYLRDWMPGQPLAANRLDALVASGVTTVVGRVDANRRDSIETWATSLELPINWGFVAVDEMGEPSPVASTFGEIAGQAWRECERLGLSANRGKIRREFFADLVVYDAGDRNAVAGPIRRVIVAGKTVWADGKLTGVSAGTFLRCCGEGRRC
jgi:Zinc carboxypeptidase